MSKRKKHSHKTTEGAGFAALVAAAAGAYFLYGSKEGAKRRKQIKGWTVKAKGEVLEKLEKVEDLNEEKYHEIVDTVAEKYKKLKHVDTEEVEQMVKELKGHWMKMKKQVETDVKKQEKKKPAAKKPAAKKAPAKKTPAKKSTSSAAKRKPASAAKKKPAANRKK